MTRKVLFSLRIMFFCIVFVGFFYPTLNALGNKNEPAPQLSSSDWPNVIKTYETQISENGATTEALHNLAFARFQNGEVSQAIAVWLAAYQKNPNDRDVKAGLKGSLKARGFDMDILDLSAQGPWLKFVVKYGSSAFYGVLKLGVTLTIIAALILFFVLLKKHIAEGSQPSQKSHARTHTGRDSVIDTGSYSSINSKTFAALLVASLGVFWLCIYLWHASLGQWGAVITPESTPLFERADEKSLVVQHLKPGLPIYIVGDTRSQWLEAYNADGFHGWVRSMDVRIVRIMR